MLSVTHPSCCMSVEDLVERPVFCLPHYILFMHTGHSPSPIPPRPPHMYAYDGHLEHLVPAAAAPGQPGRVRVCVVTRVAPVPFSLVLLRV